MPAAREIRVEREGTIDQCHHGADILAKIGQRLGGIRQDARVVARHFQGSPGEINAPSDGPPPDRRCGRQEAAENSRYAAQASAGP